MYSGGLLVKGLLSLTRGGQDRSAECHWKVRERGDNVEG